MTNSGKRKVEMAIAGTDVPAMLHTLAEQAEKGMLEIGGKRIAVDEYDTFSVSFRQTKAGMRLRVKVKYAKADQADAEQDDDTSDE